MKVEPQRGEFPDAWMWNLKISLADSPEEREELVYLSDYAEFRWRYRFDPEPEQEDLVDRLETISEEFGGPLSFAHLPGTPVSDLYDLADLQEAMK